MPCDPNSSNLSVVPGIGIPIPGFGIPISPIQLPIPNLNLPNLDNVLELINSIEAIFPGLVYKPNLDDTTNSILTALSSIFNQIAPFLGLYNFIQAAFNMVSCIIEVLCALKNPFRLIKAIRRLFRRCAVDFMKLFPFLAILAMIIALLLLIITLIEYIINAVEKIIKDLLANIETLSRGLTLQDDDSVTATAVKIAQLLCFIENLLSVLIAIGAIISVINALAGKKGNALCGGGRGRGFNVPTVDDSGCCNESICPIWLQDNPEGIPGLSGTLIYYRRINTNLQSILGISHGASLQFNLPPQRSESWQFVDSSSGQLYSFVDIITPIDTELGNDWWPDSATFTKNTKPVKAPYTVDLTLRNFDPGSFNTSDVNGARDFNIKNLIVTQRPYVGVEDYKNELDETFNTTGTLVLGGGLVYEIFSDDSDGVPYLINGRQATLETFIHHDPILGLIPTVDDGYYVDEIEFTLKINHPILLSYDLITLGCIPEVAQERYVANVTVESLGFDAVSVKLPAPLPDALGTFDCASAALQKLRTSVSAENAAIFQAELNDCLNKFKDDTLNAYCGVLRAAVSIYETKAILDTDIQFTSRSINVSVQLKDPNDTVISFNIPDSCHIEGLLDGYASLGSLSNFTYDGYSTFNADITSPIAGDGELTVSFDNNFFQTVTNPVSDDEVSSIAIDVLDYTFISDTVIAKDSGASTMEAVPRRDESDISNDGN